MKQDEHSEAGTRPDGSGPAPAIGPHADFESRLRFGLSEVLHERPELREALPLAAMLDDSVRWCA